MITHTQVQGKIINLDEHPELVSAYQVWDAQPENPQAANFVATHIKFLLYNLNFTHPNLEYLVIVGRDPIIPYRRIRDEALYLNERRYASSAHTPGISQSLALRYFLSDDYYANAGLFPLAWKGRELYLPHWATGRLVETPSEIAAAIHAFEAHPIISPTDGLVTGYDFLTDQALTISRTLVISQGITTLDALIDDGWTANDLRARLITATDTFTQARDANSLNAHFNHFALAPAHISDPPKPTDHVFAAEITDTLDYSGTLIFSVGCHSGLNVPDAAFSSIITGTDWPQVFSRQGATYIGNTGYGYGAADAMAYSEKLLTNFVQELYHVTGGPRRVDGLPTVGGALLNAKHRYYNTNAAGSLSNYDEKILGQATLYGLPMVAVRMPSTTTVSPQDPSAEALSLDYAPQQEREIVSLSLDYTPKQGDAGTYYAITNQPGADVQVIGTRPIQPRLSRNIHAPDTIAHGVLMLGGAFTDTLNFNPVIARILGESIHTDSITEPTYSAKHWHPAQIATVNRLLGSDWQSQDRLVVVPAQFMPDPIASTPTQTIGTQRRYTDLELEIYRAPIGATDYVAPSIWQVQASSGPALSLKFQMRVEDDSGSVERAVVLYRQEGDYAWTLVELPYDAATGWAKASVDQSSPPIYYFAQAVDPTGNVALALDHGKPFQRVDVPVLLYLPLILKN